MGLFIRRFAPGDAEVVLQWRYPPPYDVYNDEGQQVDAPELASSHHAILEDGELVGFCSFGADARVPGGSYPEGPVDIGLGVRPDLTGRGRGAHYLGATIAFAERELAATTLRATIAEFNARALRLYKRAGFRRVIRFEGAERPFWILIRDPDDLSTGPRIS
jgi:RimJ/RimL family protein N-acetyltransferase